MPKSILVVMMCGALIGLMAATASIGFIKSNGEFRIDGSGIRGNSTLFEGNVVETLAARSTLQVADAQLTLLPDSRARVYRDRIVLEKGSSLAMNLPPGTIQAASMRISSSTRDTQVQVEWKSSTRIVVASRGGEAQVRNASGFLVANVVSGTALVFDAQTGGAATSVTLHGVVEVRNGVYFLTDKTANITVELVGDGLQNFVGKTVLVTGSIVPGATVSAGASEVVHVVTIKAATATPTGAGGAAAGTAGHTSTATVAVIVGGVVIGGTVAGLAAAGTFSGGAGPASVQ